MYLIGQINVKLCILWQIHPIWNTRYKHLGLICPIPVPLTPKFWNSVLQKAIFAQNMHNKLGIFFAKTGAFITEVHNWPEYLTLTAPLIVFDVANSISKQEMKCEAKQSHNITSSLLSSLSSSLSSLSSRTFTVHS